MYCSQSLNAEQPAHHSLLAGHAWRLLLLISLFGRLLLLLMMMMMTLLQGGAQAASTASYMPACHKMPYQQVAFKP
jgi:hypothetical protein